MFTITCYESNEFNLCANTIQSPYINEKWVCADCVGRVCANYPDCFASVDVDSGDVCESCEEYADQWDDVSADADTLASAGWGTDEDYGG